MARRKKRGGPKRKGKRRVGAVSKSEMGLAAGVAVGVVATRFIDKFVQDKWPTANKTLVALAPAGLGAVVAMNPLKWRVLNTPFVKGVAYGMVGGGLANTGKAMGILGATNDAIVLTRRRVAGTHMPVIGDRSPNTNSYQGPWVGGKSANGVNGMNMPVIGRPSYRRRAQGSM